MSPAYVDCSDPSIVFVWSPGFGAIRVGGVWKPSALTTGELNEDFEPLPDAEVPALLSAARTSLSDNPDLGKNRAHASS
jgi:hypothetical protein